MWPAGCRHLRAGRAGQGRARQGRGREAAGLMGPRTQEGHGAARRGATSFPLASTDGKQREGGREGGRGRWRLLTAEPGRSPPAAAESRTRVADPGERQSEDARQRRRPGPLPHSVGAAERGAAQPPALPQPARVTARCRAKGGACAAPGSAAGPLPACPAAGAPPCARGCRYSPVASCCPTPGTWSRIPSKLRSVGQGRRRFSTSTSARI